MNDCQNAEIRDRLPDLLHERLSDGDRAAVIAHVDGCAECRDELELLRGVRGALIAGTPRVNTLRILSALPKPGTSVDAPMIQPRPSRSRWSDWRIAAAITVLAVGGGSLAIYTHSPESTELPPVASAPSITPVSPVSPNTTTVAPSQERLTPVAAVAAVESLPNPSTGNEVPVPGDEPVVGDGRLTNLNEQQLRTLLNDIGQLKAVPVTEPEPITIKVDTKASSGATDTEIM